MKMKLTLSLSAIAAVLLISSFISILEYRRMSNYVSELIADDIRSIHMAQKLLNVVDVYNLEILSVIGDENVNTLPDFDQGKFVSYCDSLKSSLSLNRLVPLADSVLYSYSAYMLTSLELKEVVKSDFIDTRTWYFERLQTVFNRFRGHIDKLNEGIYNDLRNHSESFDRGFYRSIIPGAVAVGVGIVLVFLLMFFIIVYYVNPLYRMLDGLDDNRRIGKKYNVAFDGDDQLSELNAGITEIAEENRQLRHRINDLKDASRKDLGR